MRALAYKVGRSRRPGRDAPNYTLSARSVLPGPLEAQGFSPNEEASHDDSKLPRPARARGTRSPGEVPVVLPQTPPGIRAGAYVSGGALCADQHVAVVGPPSRAVRELLRCSRSGRLPFRSGFFLSHLLLQEDESASFVVAQSQDLKYDAARWTPSRSSHRGMPASQVWRGPQPPLGAKTARSSHRGMLASQVWRGPQLPLGAKTARSSHRGMPASQVWRGPQPPLGAKTARSSHRGRSSSLM